MSALVTFEERWTAYQGLKLVEERATCLETFFQLSSQLNSSTLFNECCKTLEEEQLYYDWLLETKSIVASDLQQKLKEGEERV